MAIYRTVQLGFWMDSKVTDDFTPEDKYFYLYLLTNPNTNICGCYEVSYNQAANQTGYNKETVIRLLERFENVHKIIKYSKETKEILLLNWYKYNWSKSEKTLTGIENVAKHIKSAEFKKYIFYMADCIKNDTPVMGYTCFMEASVSVSVTDTDTVSVSDTVSDMDEGIPEDGRAEIDGKCQKQNLVSEAELCPDPAFSGDADTEVYKKIIDYLNARCGTKYRHTTTGTRKHIHARLAEGYTEKDFQVVIDKKCAEWMGTEQEKYLRPETLFGSKFESYLNQNIIRGRPGSLNDAIQRRVSDIDSW